MLIDILQNLQQYLPPVNEVWGKVMFLHLYVILFTRLGGVVCIHGSLHPGDTTGYGQRAGGTHPTGMHSCLVDA